VNDLRREVSSHLNPWERTEMARHPQRPYTLDYVERIFTDWSEIHGDRGFADDPAIVCGMARFHGEEVLIVGHQKARDTKQKVYRNFGMPNPEGYRKALRAMQVAAKFRRPIFTFVDTPGAYPGLGAESADRRSHRLQPARDGQDRSSIVVTITGEGAVGSASHRRRRPRPDDGELDLLGNLAGGMRLHSCGAIRPSATSLRPP